MSITVRPAVAEDVPWLLDQLQAFDKFFGARRSLIPTDVAYAEALLRNLMANHVFYVALSARGLVGFIAGTLTAHAFNPDLRVLSEVFWWVDEAERGSRAGALLFSAFHEYGLAQADWIVFTLETNSPVNPATLEKRGFRLHERNYLLEVE